MRVCTLLQMFGLSDYPPCTGPTLPRLIAKLLEHSCRQARLTLLLGGLCPFLCGFRGIVMAITG